MLFFVNYRYFYKISQQYKKQRHFNLFNYLYIYKLFPLFDKNVILQGWKIILSQKS